MSARPNPPTHSPGILGVVLAYAVFAALWILLSDRLLEWWLDTPQQVALASTVKGWLFVAVTALLLYGLLRRRQSAAQAYAQPKLPSERRLWLAMAGLSMLVIALTASAIAHTYKGKKAAETARLEAIVDLKSQQVSEWLLERMNDVRFARSSNYWAGLYQDWQEKGDLGSRDQLQQRLATFGQLMDFHAIMLLDGNGKPLWHTGEDLMMPAAGTRSDFVAAAKAKTMGWLGPYRDDEGRIHLDFFATLPIPGDGPKPILILHTDDAEFLPAKLREWPVPSDSGEVVLFRQEGDHVLYLTDLRGQAGSALTQALPLSHGDLLSARILTQPASVGKMIAGVDYKGIPVYGLGRKVPGTDWYLQAKIDQAEVFASTAHDALWIGLAGLLALIASASGLYTSRQRRHLAIARATEQAQAESLRSLQLLAAIADSSTDTIYAKDLEGRYTLFNREAARVTGKAIEAVLGLDDTALFPPDQANLLHANDQRVIDEDAIHTYEESLDSVQGKRTYLATKGPLRNSAGKIIGMFGISRDISERIQTEAALQREVSLNQRYLDTVQTIMVAIDQAGRITMINRKGCEILGYTQDELLGRNWFETCLPQPLGMETVYPVFCQIMVGDLASAEYFENPIACRNGHQRLIAWHNAYYRDDAGNIVGTLSSGEDITERKAAETALHQQAEEMKSQNAELARFNRAMVGRELDMVELKRKINALNRELGRQPPYALSVSVRSDPKIKDGDA